MAMRGVYCAVIGAINSQIHSHVMRRILSVIILILFTVYAQGTLVMWTLYQYERHDIVMYYCAPGDSPEGFMQMLSDSAQGEHGAVLVKLTASIVMNVTSVQQSIPIIADAGECFTYSEPSSFFQSILQSPPSPPPWCSIAS
ncbi:MAG: hypothetical protein JNL32_09460 [Candidatus Kapabacteria bacterium]|nr:hypothetical protein [Candidatus Kapabacteria bacterium]